MSEIPFSVKIVPGKPAYEQVIDAVHKAIATGRLKEGDRFPAIRALSKEVRINPNTAHKVVQHLVTMGTLEVLPGKGTRVAPKAELPLEAMIEQLDIDAFVIEAIRLGFNKTQLTKAVQAAWEKLKNNNK